MEVLNLGPKGSRAVFQGALATPFQRHHIPCGVAAGPVLTGIQAVAAGKGHNGAETLNKAEQIPDQAKELLHYVLITTPLQPSVIFIIRLFYCIFHPGELQRTVSHRTALSCSQGNLLCLSSALQVNKYHGVISSTCRV